MGNEDLEKKLLNLLKDNEMEMQRSSVVYNTFIQNAEGSKSSIEIGSEDKEEYKESDNNHEVVEESDSRDLEETEYDVETNLENPEARKNFRKLIREAIEMRTKHDLEKGSKPIHVEGIETYISWKKEEGSSKTELRTYLTDLGWRAEQVDFFIKEYYVNPKVKREGFFRRVFHRLRRKSLEERVLQDIQTEIADPSEIFPPIVPSIEPRSQSYRLRPPEESLNEVFEHSEDEFQYSKIWTSQCIAKLVASEAYAHLRMSENIPELQIRKEMSERNIVIGDNSMDKMFDNYS